MTHSYRATDYDRQFYRDRLMPFLPESIVDCHAHTWLAAHARSQPTGFVSRSAVWAREAATAHPVGQLLDSYRDLLPTASVTPILLPWVEPTIDRDANNHYVRREAAALGTRAMALTTPELSATDVERLLDADPVVGIKPYLNFAPAYIPTDEIRIFDFLPRAHLEVLDRRAAAAVLHIPRPGRLADPVNLAQLGIIDREYTRARIIVTHIGRAYAAADAEGAMAVLARTKNLLFDFSANTNAAVLADLIEAVGPERVLYGSDLPIFAMRAHRVVEGNRYINIVPRGSNPAAAADPSIRETDEVDRLTLLLYEQLDAFRSAAERLSLTREDVEKVFCGNAERELGLGPCSEADG